MSSGGSRANSGPAPDPNALRRNRKDDGEWTTLPAEGFTGEVPGWPLTPGEDLASVELGLWADLWSKPQAVMWDRLGLKFQVAMYVRTFAEASAPGAAATLKTAALRMEEEIGLSIPGMRKWRWKFAVDELSARRDAVVVPVSNAPSARERWASANEG